MVQAYERTYSQRADVALYVNAGALGARFGLGILDPAERAGFEAAMTAAWEFAEREISAPVIAAVAVARFDVRWPAAALDLRSGRASPVNHWLHSNPTVDVDGVVFTGETFIGTDGQLRPRNANGWGGCDVKVTYGVGFEPAAIPGDLEWAVGRMGVDAWRGRDRAGNLERETLVGVYDAAYREGGAPAEVLEILDLYKVVTV